MFIININKQDLIGSKYVRKEGVEKEKEIKKCQMVPLPLSCLHSSVK